MYYFIRKTGPVQVKKKSNRLWVARGKSGRFVENIEYPNYARLRLKKNVTPVVAAVVVAEAPDVIWHVAQRLKVSPPVPATTEILNVM